MTKSQFIELVRRYMSGGNLNDDLAQRYGEGVISKLIELAYNEMVYLSFKNAYNTKDYSPLDIYTKSYNIDVSYNNDRKHYYSTLPVSVINLPDNNGIQKITYLEDDTTEFKYLPALYSSAFSKLEASKLTDAVYYKIEGDKIIYKNLDNAIIKVLIYLIVPFDEFEDDENISLPAENAMYMFNIIQDMLKKELPEKLTIDQTSKQI